MLLHMHILYAHEIHILLTIDARKTLYIRTQTSNSLLLEAVVLKEMEDYVGRQIINVTKRPKGQYDHLEPDRTTWS